MVKNFKIAIVHDFLTTMGGAEKVTQVLSNMFPGAPIYTLLYNPKLAKHFTGKKIIVSSLQYWYRFFKLPVKFLLPFMPSAIESFDFSDYDLVISSSNSFAKGIITRPSTFHLSYCHSPTRYLWDATHTYVEEQNLPFYIKNKIYKILHSLRIWDKLAADRVDKYIANSYYVKNRIKKYYKKDASVIYPPVDTEKIKPSSKNSDYFLIVSRLVNYKKINIAIKACNNLELPLVIIGEGPSKKYLQKISGPTIEFLGWQSDKNKIEYLRNSRALIFPGEEDFGIVPVEAMAAGKAVIAFNKGGVKESVIENKTGIFFNELTAKSLILAIRQFIAQENKFDTDVIVRQASKFSQNNFRQAILKEVEKILNI